MAQWQHKVQAHLEGLKRYPPLALKQKRQGTVTVHFDINKEGEIISSSLSKTSGVRLLDNATVQLIARADPLPKPPEHIASQRLSIEVPIRYFIR
nr:energy transducer TonB [Colwellia sp. E2M01]